MMVIVGAHSLLGAHLSKKLNEENFNYLALSAPSSDLTQIQSQPEIKFWQLIDIDSLADWVVENAEELECIFWCIPSQSNSENQLFTTLWLQCYQHQIPFLFSTYDVEIERWINHQDHRPFFWVGLLTGQLYGTGENQFETTSEVNQAIRNLLDDTDQTGDLPQVAADSFTYVTDLTDVIYFFIRHRQHSGFYNLPRERADLPLLLHFVKQAIDGPDVTEEVPKSTERVYTQYSLKEIGYLSPFHSLREGINSVVKNFLASEHFIPK